MGIWFQLRRAASAQLKIFKLSDYVSAIGLAGVAIFFRAVLEAIAPGIAYFVVLLPAVVFAGAFLGTGPAIVTAGVGFLGIAVLFLHAALLVWPPFNPVQLDTIIFLPACIAVIWATHAMRASIFAAQMAEARFAEVFRQIPGAAAVLEAPSGRLLMRSNQSEAVLGHPSKQLDQSDDLIQYGGVHPDGQPYQADEYPIVRALKNGEIVNGELIKYRRPDGNVVDLEVHAGPVRSHDGRILASVGMAFDISERMDADRRLKESEAIHRALAVRLRAAVDACALGIWEVDLSTDRISLDATFAAILGMPSEPIEMTRSDFRNFIEPADKQRVVQAFAGAAAQGSIYSDEYRMRSCQGDIRWIVSRGAVLADLQKVVGIAGDITERREREDALKDALQAREILMHEADHRIKNSLQLVISMLRLQLNGVLDASLKEVISETIARVDAVANAHLALQSSPDLRSIELDQMLKDLSRGMGLLNSLIVVSCDSQTGLWLDTDRAIPLGLLVSELLTNALKHAFPAGAPGEVCIETKISGELLEIIIADGGVGLPAAPTRKGLGSKVISVLASQIGANVTTESRPGCGTKVIIHLKLPVS
jgi:PAS domain S-box-containing protein